MTHRLRTAFVEHRLMEILFSILILLMLILIGCGGNNGDETKQADSYSYQGSWIRQAKYVDGKLTDQTPVKLLFTRTTFNSAGFCSITGKMDVEGKTMQITVQTSTCQGYTPGMEYTSTFEFSDNGNVITILTNDQGTETREIYNRKVD